MSCEELELVCSLCSEVYVSREALLAHILSCHNDVQSMRCFTLKKLETKSASVLFHYYGNKYRCKTCSYKTEYRVLFEEHARCHMHELPYKCFWCSKDLEGYELPMHFTKEHSSRLRVRFTSVLQSNAMEKILKNLGPKAPLLIKPRVHRLIPLKASASASDNQDMCREIDYNSLLGPSVRPIPTSSSEPITIEDDDEVVAIEDSNPMTLCISSVQSLGGCSQDETNGAVPQNSESTQPSLDPSGSNTTTKIQEDGKSSEGVSEDMEGIIVKVENDVDGYSEHEECRSGMVHLRSGLDFLSSEDSVDDNIRDHGAGASCLISASRSNDAVAAMPGGSVESRMTEFQRGTSAENFTDRSERTLGSIESAMSAEDNNCGLLAERSAMDCSGNNYDSNIVENILQRRSAENSVPLDLGAFVETVMDKAFNIGTASVDTACIMRDAGNREDIASCNNDMMTDIPMPVTELQCTSTNVSSDSSPSCASNKRLLNMQDVPVDNQSNLMDLQDNNCGDTPTQPVVLMSVEESPFRIVSVSECHDIIPLDSTATVNAGTAVSTMTIIGSIVNATTTQVNVSAIAASRTSIAGLDTPMSNLSSSPMRRAVSASSVSEVNEPVTNRDAARHDQGTQRPPNSPQLSTSRHRQSMTGLDCNVCHSHLENPLDRARHDVWHVSGMAKVQCSAHRCDFIIVSLDGFIQHMLDEHKPFDSYSCPQCSKMCDTLEMFVSHLRSARMSVWRCQECRFTCTDSCEIGEHIRSSHPGIRSMAVAADQLKCKSGLGQYSQQSSAVLTCNDLSTMQCPYCTFAATNTGYLLLHLAASHHTDGIRCHTCSSCGFQATTRCIVTDHIASVHAGELVTRVSESRELVTVDGLFVCPLCDVRFDYLQSLAQHAKLVHPRATDVPQPLIESFHCEICAYSASEDGELVQHMSTAHPNHPQRASLLRHSHNMEGNVLGSITVASTGTIRPVAKKSLSGAAGKKLSSTLSKERAKKVPCPKCPLVCCYRTSWQFHVDMHERVEKRGWWYECPQCLVVLADKYGKNDKHHQRIHPTLPFVPPRRVHKSRDTTVLQSSSVNANKVKHSEFGSAAAVPNMHATKKSKSITSQPVNRLKSTKLFGAKIVTGIAAKKTSLKKDKYIRKNGSKVCPLCKYTCVNEYIFNQHASVHRVIEQQGWWTQCEYCVLMLDNAKKMTDHQRSRHHGQPQKFRTLFKEDVAKPSRSRSRSRSNSECDNLSDMAHIDSESVDEDVPDKTQKGGRFTCTQCAYTTKSGQGVSNHQRVHRRAAYLGYIYKCDTCDLPFNSSDSFKGHCRRFHPNHEGKKLTFTKYDVNGSSLTVSTKQPNDQELKWGPATTSEEACTSSSLGSANKDQGSVVIKFSCDQCSFVAKFNFALIMHKKIKHNADLCEDSTVSSAIVERSVSVSSNEADLNTCDGVPATGSTSAEPYFEDYDSLDDDDGEEETGIEVESMCDKDWITSTYKCRQCSFVHRYLSIVSRHFVNSHVSRRVFRCYYCSSFESWQSSKVIEHCRLQHASRELRLIKRPPAVVTSGGIVIPVSSAGVSDLDIEIVGAGNSARLNRCLAHCMERQTGGEWACRLCKHQALSTSALHVRRHILTQHLKIQLYSCKYCGTESDKLSEVKAHIVDVHSSLPLRVIKKQLDAADVEDKLVDLWCTQDTSASDSNAKVRGGKPANEVHQLSSTFPLVRSAQSECSAVDQSNTPSTSATINNDTFGGSASQMKSGTKPKRDSNLSDKKDEGFSVRLYYCGHCSKTRQNINAMKHHILTDHFHLQLYQCAYCSYSHELAVKVKGHSKKTHKRIQNKVGKSADWDLITMDANRVMKYEGVPVGANRKTEDHAADDSTSEHEERAGKIRAQSKQPSRALNGGKGQSSISFVCRHCKQTYNSMKLLKNHIFSHFHDQVYVCSECDANCCGKLALKNHFFSDHPGQNIKVHDIADKLRFVYSGDKVFAEVKDDYVHPSFALETSDPPVVQSVDNSRRSSLSSADAVPSSSAGKTGARTNKTRISDQQSTFSATPARSRRSINSSSTSSLTQQSFSATPSHDASPLYSREQRNSTPMPSSSVDSGSQLQTPQPIVSSTTECKSFCCRHCGLLANSLLSIVEHLVCHFKDGSFCCTHCDFPDERCSALRDHYKLSHGVELYNGWLMCVSDMVEKRMVGSRTMVSVRDESSATAGASFTYDSPSVPPPLKPCSNSKTSQFPMPPCLSPQAPTQVRAYGETKHDEREVDEKSVTAKVSEKDDKSAKVSLWKCKHCLWSSKCKSAVHSHMSLHYNGPLVICLDCKKKFVNKAALNVHYASVHPRCGIRYKMASLLDKFFITRTGNTAVASMKANFLGQKKSRTDKYQLQRSSDASGGNGKQSASKKRRTSLDDSAKDTKTTDVDCKFDISTINPEKGSDSTQIIKGEKTTKMGAAIGSASDVHECVLCGSTFTEINRAVRHVRKVHMDKGALKCELCGLEFEYHTALESHHALLHPGLSLTTTNVAEELRAECLSYLQKKSSDEVVNEPFSCFKCSFTTERIQNMRSHLYKEYGYRPFECGQCGRKFVSKLVLYRHAHFTHGDNVALLMNPDTKIEHQIEQHLRDRCSGRLRQRASMPNSSPASSPSKQSGKGKAAFAKVGVSMAYVQKRAALGMKYMQERKQPHPSAESPLRKRTYSEADPEARIDSEVSCQPKQSKLDTDAWLVCPLCPSRLFSSRMGLDIHTFNIHQEETCKLSVVSCAVRCPYCQVCCDTDEAVVAHIVANHQLPISSLMLENAQNDHASGSRDVKTVPCMLCDSTFESVADLNNHVLLHLPVYTVECAYCGYEAAKRWDIMKHSVENHPFRSIVAVLAHKCIKRQHAVRDSGGVLTSTVTLQPLVYLRKMADAEIEARQPSDASTSIS